MKAGHAMGWWTRWRSSHPALCAVSFFLAATLAIAVALGGIAIATYRDATVRAGLGLGALVALVFLLITLPWGSTSESSCP
jgi:hypothetical protein